MTHIIFKYIKDKNYDAAVSELDKDGFDFVRNLNNGSTILHYSIRMHFNKFIEFILENRGKIKNFDIDFENNQGFTAIQSAIGKFHKSIIT